MEDQASSIQIHGNKFISSIVLLKWSGLCRLRTMIG